MRTWWPPTQTHEQLVTGAISSQASNCFGGAIASGALCSGENLSYVAFSLGGYGPVAFVRVFFFQGFCPRTV